MNKINKFLSNTFLILILVLILALSIRGLPGNPNPQTLNSAAWKEDGPFELSPERGRYGLLYSLVENKSFYFTPDIARFIIPDLGYKDGNYVSLFAPGVSFLSAPGYMIGKYFGLAQVGAFSAIALFGIINLYLIKEISVSLGAKPSASWIAGIIFLFATPAFAYSVNLYQHHISTFLILAAILILIKAKRTWPLFFVFLLCAASIPVDYPNLFLMAPIGIFAVLKFVDIFHQKDNTHLKIKLTHFWTVFGILIPLFFFMWFNQSSYGNPLQFSGTVASVGEIDAEGNPAIPQRINPTQVSKFLNPEEQRKSTLTFFNPRKISNGLNILFFSPDRGVLFYAPIMLFAILGGIFMSQKNKDYLGLLTSIITANITLYSMWGDPWGGWAFGARYLIPAYALSGIMISFALSKLNRKIYFLIPFYLVLLYCVGINTLGAITTSSIPPRVEALPLEALTNRRERYSVDRNWEFLTGGRSKSFIFQTVGKNYLDTKSYYYLVTGLIAALGTFFYLKLIFFEKNKVK